jgi:hypothetical protein
MAIEDRDDFVDVVAQAVIDRIEERHRVNGLVEQVVARVIEIQKKEAALKAEVEAEAQSTKTVEE